MPVGKANGSRDEPGSRWGLGVDGLGWRDVVDVRSDMERVEHLALGHHGRRLELAERTTRGDRDRQASRRQRRSPTRGREDANDDPSTAAPTPASDASVATRPG